MSGPVTSNNINALTETKRNRSGNRLKFFSDVFPYLLVPVVVYIVIAAFSGSVGTGREPAIHASLNASAFEVPMLTGVLLRITWGELMVIFATLFLFVEVIKSTNTASAGIVNHILSMALFVVCLMLFLMFESFATGTFFIMTAMVLVDALAGMVVTIISARRDFGVEGF